MTFFFVFSLKSCPCSQITFPIEELKAEFEHLSQDFHIHGSLFSYLIKPGILNLTTTQLELFSLMDIKLIMILKTD